MDKLSKKKQKNQIIVYLPVQCNDFLSPISIRSTAEFWSLLAELVRRPNRAFPWGVPRKRKGWDAFFSFVLDNGGARRRYLFLRRYRSARYQIS